jgi:hypothetical protein
VKLLLRAVKRRDIERKKVGIKDILVSKKLLKRRAKNLIQNKFGSSYRRLLFVSNKSKSKLL